MIEIVDRKAEHGVDPLFVGRWSPRALSGEALGPEELLTLFEAARWAPSCFNNQSVRSSLTALLQVWVGSDEEHRLTIDKLAGILKKSGAVIPQDDIPLEVEYEDGLISQYPVEGFEAGAGALVLELGQKHTDCLAKDKCSPTGCGTESKAVPVRLETAGAPAPVKAGCCSN